MRNTKSKYNETWKENDIWCILWIKIKVNIKIVGLHEKDDEKNQVEIILINFNQLSKSEPKYGYQQDTSLGEEE